MRPTTDSSAWPDNVTPKPFKKNWPLFIMMAVFVIVWIICAINPVKWFDWILDNLLLVVFVGLIALLYRTFAFSNISYFCMMLFLMLHTIGAHYTYQHIPVNDWLNNLFHMKRAMYDRMVHFAFGLLMAFPVFEAAVRVMRVRSPWTYVVTFAMLLACGALFEIIEMLVALVLGGSGQKYLGLQGDVMDTPKDMSMNAVGSMLSIGFISLYRYFGSRKRSS